MWRIRFALLLGLVLVASGCGYSSHNYMNGGGNPHINQIMPNMATAGSAAFQLMVTGTGFGTDSVLYWGTSPRTTTYTTSTQVSANITAMDIAASGTVQVYVRSGGVNSNMATFTIQ